MSNNLDLDQVAPNQDQKTVTINDANGQIDAAVTERFPVDVSGGNQTVSADDYRRHVYFDITGATVAGREVTLQSIKHLVVVSSSEDATQSVDVKLGTTTITIPATEKRLVYTDGTANGLFIISGSETGNPTSTTVITVDNTNAATVTQAALELAAIVQVDENGGTPPTGDITLTFDSFQRGIFVVYNNTQQAVFCSISGQSLPAVEIPPATSFTLTMDNANVQEAGAPTTTKDFEFFIIGAVTPVSTLIGYFVATEDLVFKVGLPNAQGWVFTTDVVARSYQISINESSVGSVDFASSSQTATFTFATEMKMSPGDRLDVRTPVAVTTQAFFSCTLPATRR